MQKIIIQKGDSARIAIVLPEDKMADVEDVVCSVGGVYLFKKSDNTLIATATPNVFHLDLTSKKTNALIEDNELSIAVDYSDLGVKKTAIADNLVIQVDKNVNTFFNDSASDLVLATITVVINDDVVNTDVNLASYIKGEKGDTGNTGATGADGADGDSAYQVAVSNGFVGTESQWLVSLKGEQGPAGQSFVKYKDTAPSALISGATEQFLIAIPIASIGFTVGSWFTLKNRLERPIRVGNNCIIKYYTHTSSSWSIGQGTQIGTYTASSNQGLIPFKREFSVQSDGTLSGFHNNISLFSDDTVTQGFSSTTFAGKTHIIVTVQQANTTDTIRSREVIITGEV